MVSADHQRRYRLARTLSRARWGQYRRLLLAAIRAGYRVVPLERWVLEPDSGTEPVIVLRHDVDQHPRTALRMARIECDLGLRSTYYFRWRTADGRVIARLQEWGFEVGLHYETLTRAALRGATDYRDPALLARCREELAREVRAFADLHGELRSVCPHGDSRVPGASNAVLLADGDPSSFGIAFASSVACHAICVSRTAGWSWSAPDTGTRKPGSVGKLRIAPL